MKIPAQIQQAIQAYYAERATDGDIAALEAWFREDEGHIKAFAEHGMIEWQMLCEQEKADAAAILKVLSEAEEQAEPDFSLLHTPSFQASSEQSSNQQITARELTSLVGYLLSKGIRSKAGVIGSLAAVLLLGAVLALVFLLPGDSTNTTGIVKDISEDNQIEAVPIVATLSAEHDTVWGRRPGEDLYAGQQFTLKQGFAEITTAGGAVAILQGSATFKLLNNDNGLYLQSGRLVGLCHTESSKGFVVLTDHAEITDLGTEFGVTAGPGRVESTVFMGEVAVKMGAEPVTVITQHQTAQVSVENGSIFLDVDDVLAEGYTRRMPRPALVKSARVINGNRHQASIASQAFYESALLYKDRGYRLAPASGSELPEALLGGDIVQMPVGLIGQAKGEPIGVELTTEVPVAVYLLRPPNAKPYEWLEQDYINTGMAVAFQSASEHGGKSCEIWKRKALAVGTVTVAGDISRRFGDGMYTLVVTPAEND
ncbi:MAG: FecR domain-containing protein [Planctomycetota bacterium]